MSDRNFLHQQAPPALAVAFKEQDMNASITRRHMCLGALASAVAFESKSILAAPPAPALARANSFDARTHLEITEWMRVAARIGKDGTAFVVPDRGEIDDSLRRGFLISTNTFHDYALPVEPSAFSKTLDAEVMTPSLVNHLSFCPVIPYRDIFHQELIENPAAMRGRHLKLNRKNANTDTRGNRNWELSLEVGYTTALVDDHGDSISLVANAKFENEALWIQEYRQRDPKFIVAMNYLFIQLRARTSRIACDHAGSWVQLRDPIIRHQRYLRELRELQKSASRNGIANADVLNHVA